VNTFRIIFVLVILILVGLQLVHTPRNESTHHSKYDLFAKYPAPAAIEGALRESCYDCHSDNTRYPWYDTIQPVAWWVGRHVEEGRDHLDFSEFGRYSTKQAARKLSEAYDEIDDDTMPLKSYRLLHPKSRLSPQIKKQVLAWLEATQDKIEPDSDQ
jgi:hypothetical protein